MREGTAAETGEATASRIAIALGSNLGDREANLDFGRDELAKRGLVWSAVSSSYETAPVGPVADQPPFLNQVAVGETFLSPQALLEVCLSVEQARGRERMIHWGPRTLDLDVLLYGAARVLEPNLTVPHPELANRAFVLVPLAEIAGGWVVPGYNKTVRELLAGLDSGREGVQVWRSSDTR
ncbi:MAG: 2-amino-4-hydroxy-6-hydroxymethyldihydropteridine diphosphokinase [Cytophagales bacterium]|nr:2-amino-4-hydroxy-6-hydroxymethyldihydropteridine diphosphokinase [Armatimonadota bacterium]